MLLVAAGIILREQEISDLIKLGLTESLEGKCRMAWEWLFQPPFCGGVQKPGFPGKEKETRGQAKEGGWWTKAN